MHWSSLLVSVCTFKWVYKHNYSYAFFPLRLRTRSRNSWEICLHSGQHKQINSCYYNIVLVTVGIQLILFTATHMMLCFGFVPKTALIMHPHFSCCWTVLIQHWGLCFLGCPASEEAGSAEGAGRGHSWHSKLRHFLRKCDTCRSPTSLNDCKSARRQTWLNWFPYLAHPYVLAHSSAFTYWTAFISAHEFSHFNPSHLLAHPTCRAASELLHEAWLPTGVNVEHTKGSYPSLNTCSGTMRTPRVAASLLFERLLRDWQWTASSHGKKSKGKKKMEGAYIISVYSSKLI